MNTSRWITSSSILSISSACAGTLIAVEQNLPARFGGILQGDDALEGFLSLDGTALSAPLLLLLAQLLCLVSLSQPGGLRNLGLASLAMLGIGNILAQLGEPVLVESFRADTFDSPRAAVIATNLATGAAMAALSLRALWSHLTRRYIDLTRGLRN